MRSAVERVVQSLDEALDLAELARAAALSPLHFHRIFRGMVGETPLELHRRLRLERAACRLVDTDAKVTSIAFEAGYETHESFTRSFREAYSMSPSDFRARARDAGLGSARPPIALGARRRLHFNGPLDPGLIFALERTEPALDVVIESLPEQRVAAISHVGPYSAMLEAFRRLEAIAKAHGLRKLPGAAIVTIYHDDPEAVPQAELRSEAGILVPAESAIPPPLCELIIPAGRYARTTHVGDHRALAHTWERFMGDWLPHSGQRTSHGVMYDVYRNTCVNVAPDELRTELYLPIA